MIGASAIDSEVPNVEVRLDTLGRWFHEIHERYRQVVVDLAPEALSWTPGPETNSIAVLVRHTVASEKGMLFGLAGHPVDRNLPADFVSRPTTASELLRLLDEADDRVDEMFALISEDALTASYSRPHDQVLTGVEWAVNTYGHAKEHIAHAELTAQLLRFTR